MADSFVPDSFAPDAPAKAAPKAEHAKPIGPERPSYTPHRTALDAILNPQGAVEHAVSLPASMALTGGAGALASRVLPNLRYAPALARSAMEGLQRGAGAAVQGGDLSDILTRGGLGAATGVATEGIMGLAGKLGSRLSGTARVRELEQMAADKSRALFERAQQLPAEAFDAIRNRLQGRQLFGGGVTLPLSLTTIKVPSLSKKALPVEDAIQQLSGLKSPKWDVAVDEIATALNKLDKGTAAKKAGDRFRAMLPQTVTEPLQGPGPLLPNTNLARTVADVLTGSPIEGMPVGALAAGGATAGQMPHMWPLAYLFRGGH